MPYDQLASQESIDKTVEAIKNRGVDVIFVQNKEQALEEVKNSIPDGSNVMTGGSVTLEQIGFTDLLLSHKHPWNNLKDGIMAEKDTQKQSVLRKQSILADYFLGSVHAISETGELVFASATGSQIPAYAFSSNHVIWITGAQKIVPTLDEAVKRVREYCLTKEDERQKKNGAPGSFIGKLMIFEKEAMPNRKLKLILVNEKVGV